MTIKKEEKQHEKLRTGIQDIRNSYKGYGSNKSIFSQNLVLNRYLRR